MSYARLTDTSDVYVYITSNGYYHCCWCGLNGNSIFDDPTREREKFRTTDLMLAHLDQHRDHGDMVEDSTYAEIREDQEENDANLAAANAEIYGPAKWTDLAVGASNQRVRWSLNPGPNRAVFDPPTTIIDPDGTRHENVAYIDADGYHYAPQPRTTP